MSYRVAINEPREVEVGQPATLTLPVFADDGTEQTAPSGTLTVRLGSTVLLNAVAVTTVGPPVSYSLLGATTSGMTPTDEWAEEWNLGTLGVFTHSGYLVRRAYHSRVTDPMLQEYHGDLLTLLASGETTAEKFRVAATRKVRAELIKRGRRPHLVFDSWALADAERLWALSLWASDVAMRTSGESDYARLAAQYREEFKLEMASVQFRYDDDNDGVMDEDETESASPSMYVLTSGRPRYQLAAA